MILCLLLFAFELGLTHALIYGALSFLAFIFLHSAGILFCILILQQKLYKFKKMNLYLISLTLTTVTGVFGAATGLLAGTLFLYNRKSHLFPLSVLGLETDNQSQADEEPELVASLSEKDIKNKSYVMPFKEIIKGGTLNQKIEALTKISQHYRPEFAPALLDAKKDVKNNIRVLSASTISKIDQKFMRRYKNLILKHGQEPESPIVLLNLARHASAYADCGILDDFRQKHFREKSIYYFKKYLKLNPTDQESHLTIAKLYSKNNQGEQAIEIFRHLMRHNVKLNLIDSFWYFESLYNKGDYALIRDHIEKFETLKALPENSELFVLKDILIPWGGGALKSERNVA